MENEKKREAKDVPKIFDLSKGKEQDIHLLAWRTLLEESHVRGEEHRGMSGIWFWTSQI